MRSDEGFATAGSLVRDQNVTKAELWGILDGLKLILDRRFERILSQTDSLEVANAIQEGFFSTSNSTLLRRIRQSLAKVKQWKIQHISQEENTLVDSIVKTICDRKLGLRLFEDPPLRV
uniref:RNase H type-1 domain-containing protein n=1 Tax=Gossypium raimondii TaxID=29730 RepID=A0A0D2TK71_GOSRA|nr:hypothetical protein B456_012G074500 [Gossypium raimondii]